jgi:ABC-type transporter MlaC component
VKKSIFIIVALVLMQISLFNSSAIFAQDASVDKPVKIAIKGIQAKQYDLASQQLDYDAMSRIVMGQYWDQMSEDQKKEMTAGVEVLIKKISFPRGTEMFQHLSTINYGKPSIKGSKAKIKTTIVVYQNYKKAEVVMNFELKKNGNKWKIAEIIMMDEPILGGIYLDEIKPMVKKGGIDSVMKAMRTKIAQVK